MNEDKFLITPRERNFYERNIGKDVNLYTSGQITHSGVLVYYDGSKNEVGLRDYIKRIYDEEGRIMFLEASEEIPISLNSITWPELASKEDRTGRIARYNGEVRLEDLERSKKIENLFPKSEDNVSEKRGLIRTWFERMSRVFDYKIK